MKKYSLLLLTFIPSVLFAQSIGTITDAESWVLDMLGKLNYLFWLVAIAVFTWGVVKFIANANDATEREKGKSLIIGGIISFVVLASVWAIVELILQDTFGIFSSPVPYVDSSGVTH